MNNPIKSMLKYAQSEPWDLVSSEHDRHHLPIFIQSGIRKLIWLPCFTMNPYRHEPKIETDMRPVFVGSLSPHHKYRTYLLNELRIRGIEINITTAPQNHAALLYNTHRVSINISLNGDLNFRIMEIFCRWLPSYRSLRSGLRIGTFAKRRYSLSQLQNTR